MGVQHDSETRRGIWSGSLLGGAVAGGVTAVAVLGSLAMLDRPATADSAAPAQASTVAVCDVYGVLETALQSTVAITEREATSAMFVERIEGLNTELQNISEKVQELGFENPESQALVPEFQQKQQQMQQMQQQLQAILVELYGEQMQTAYGKILAATDEIAAEGGYDVVIASRPASGVLERGPVEVMIQELLARPVIRSPEAVDITLAVRERLDLPELTEDPADNDDQAADTGGDTGGEMGDDTPETPDTP
ncbi:MAG: OmpH family outer membrane protein [Planctomycetota bacterium]